MVFWSLGVGLAGWFPYAYGVTAEDLCVSYADIALRIVGAVPETPAVRRTSSGARKRGG